MALGAFAAHGLRSRVAPELPGTFEAAARYHFYHALGLFAASWVATRWPGGAAFIAGWLALAWSAPRG